MEIGNNMENKKETKWDSEYKSYLAYKAKRRSDPAILVFDYGGMFLLISGIALMVDAAIGFQHVNIVLAATGAAISMFGWLVHYIGIG
jgi:hypothetical protein